MKKLLTIMMVLLFVAGCNAQWIERDVDVTFHWTSVHEDAVPQDVNDSLISAGVVPADYGRCTVYDFRWSDDSLVLANWVDADTMSGEPLPALPYQSEEFNTILRFKKNTTYFVGLKVSDGTNWSNLSNVIRIDVGDIILPALIIDLRFVEN